MVTCLDHSKTELASFPGLSSCNFCKFKFSNKYKAQCLLGLVSCGRQNSGTVHSVGPPPLGLVGCGRQNSGTVHSEGQLPLGLVGYG